MFICSEDQSCTTCIHPCPLCSLQIKAKVSYRFSYLDSSFPKTLCPARSVYQISKELTTPSAEHYHQGPLAPLVRPNPSYLSHPIPTPSTARVPRLHFSTINDRTDPRRAAIILAHYLVLGDPWELLIYTWTFLLRLRLEVYYCHRHQVRYQLGE